MISFRRLKKHPVRSIIAIIIIAVTVGIIFTPNIYIIKSLSGHSPKIVIILLVLGIVFMNFRRDRLMFVSLSCCAILCLHLRAYIGSSLNTINLSGKSKEISIANYQLSEVNNLDFIKNESSDIITMLDWDKEWEAKISPTISEIYPYSFVYNELGLHSMAMYSKYPFTNKDTNKIEGKVNLSATLIKMQDSITVHLINTEPITSTEAYSSLNNRLKEIGENIKNRQHKQILLGSFNIVPYSREMQELITNSNLQISNRAFKPTPHHKTNTIFNIPVDHILYSNEMECIEITALEDSSATHIGLKGKYAY